MGSLRALVFLLIAAAVVFYPVFPIIDWFLQRSLGLPVALERPFIGIFIFSLLALAQNLELGFAGLLQLGMAAFFALGAYITGILTVAKFPFQLGFWGAFALAPWIVGGIGILLGAPTVRLRGDALAIVTLGFAEVVRVVLLGMENLTDGSRGLNPLPPPHVPAFLMHFVERNFAVTDSFSYRLSTALLYYISLSTVVVVYGAFRAVERSALGRAMMAIREDELAASAMGISPARVRLYAFALGSAVAGLAGVLYATFLTTTAEPSTYDFNCSVMILCAVVVGGIGSLKGAVLGTALLVGFDSVLSPIATRLLSRFSDDASGLVWLNVANWRWFFFGALLIVMMRLRPEGLWPAGQKGAA